jgi:hypothetical protein
LPKISVADCLELSLPSGQYGLSKRAAGCFDHGAAPNLVIALSWLLLGKAFDGLPSHVGFVAQIVAQAVSLLVLGYAKEDWQSHIPPAQLA